MKLKIVLVESKCFLQGNGGDDDRWIVIIEDLDNIHDIEDLDSIHDIKDLQCCNSTQIQWDYSR